MKKIGVLISGGGTNLQALIDKQGTVLKSGKIVCVCSNNSKAYGLERAKNAGIATKVIRKNADCRGDNDEFNRQICAYMKEMDVDVIVLAGFLAILGGDLLKEYANKIGAGIIHISHEERVVNRCKYVIKLNNKLKFETDTLEEIA